MQEIQKSLHQNWLRMHSAGTVSVKDSLGLWDVYHSENSHSHKSWLAAMITFCSLSKLCIHLFQTLIWQMASEQSKTCLESPQQVEAGPGPQPVIPTSCSHASFFLSALNPFPWGLSTSQFFFAFTSLLGPGTCLEQKCSINTNSVNKQRCRCVWERSLLVLI